MMWTRSRASLNRFNESIMATITLQPRRTRLWSEPQGSIEHIAQLFCGRRVVWDFYGVHANSCQHLQGKREAELALVDPVDQNLGLHEHPELFKVARQLLVADAVKLSAQFDDVLCFSFEIRARIHGFSFFLPFLNRFRFIPPILEVDFYSPPPERCNP